MKRGEARSASRRSWSVVLAGVSCLGGLTGCVGAPESPRIERTAEARSEMLGPGAAYLLKDIDPRSTPRTYSSPSKLTAVGSTVFFTATEPGTGQELWKSDGTTAGTVLVRDILPGTVGSAPFELVEVGGTLFLSATDASHGTELWKSDGTATGTVLVKDVCPGSATSSVRALARVDDTLFFVADDCVHGQELWKSDGSAAGTVLVADINPGAGGSAPYELTNVGGTLFFLANNGVIGNELWKSDGSAAGTVLVKDINPGAGNSTPSHLTNVNGTLFFAALDPAAGLELWKSDGTSAGTVLVKDINPGTANSLPSYLTDVNGTLFFTALDPATGVELWKSDGTADGTVLVSDIYPGATGSSPSNLTASAGSLFFIATDPAVGKRLRRSDGTAAGTAVLSSDAGFPGTAYITEVDGTVFFAATTLAGSELWKSDGTPAGTVLVSDINAGSGYSTPEFLANVNGTLFFSADDGVTGKELWKSEGTAATTVRVAEINRGPTSSSASSFTAVNGKLFFVADDGSIGRELYWTDGTPGGTGLVKDIVPGFNGSYPMNLIGIGETLYFSAGELWKSDGTEAGTILVKDVYPGEPKSSLASFSAGRGMLFFYGDDGTHGGELWKSDGTEAGSVLVKDINPGAAKSTATGVTDVDGTLFFNADDGTHGGELWKTDGTVANTVLVEDIYPGASWSNPGWRTRMGGALFFSANDGTHGVELWKSDGTADGTVLVEDINPGASGSSPSRLTVLGSTLFFLADDGVHGAELWKSDGTAEGTVLVDDITPGPTGTVTDLVAMDGALFFAADDGAGPALWTSDGTPEGTLAVLRLERVSDVAALPPGFGQVVFAGYEPDTGLELWASDGTAAGTRLIADVDPGNSSSSPAAMKAAGTHLVFTAYTPAYGVEPWAIPLSAFDLTPPVVTPSAAGSLGLGGWYVSDVDVSFAVADGQSPVTSASGCDAIAVTTDTAGATFTCIATSTGGTASASITIRRDATAPAVLCPGDVVTEAASAGGSTVEYPESIASDALTASPLVEYSRASGDDFPLGATMVDVTATDDAGNVGRCSFEVRVVDTIAPSITCGPDVVAEATGAAGTQVGYAPATAADAVTASPVLTYSRPSGSVFPLGTTTLTASATDEAGNTATCSFTVTVRDTTPPAIECPAGVSAEATSPSGAAVTFPSAVATDAVTATPSIVYSRSSGATFSLGTTTVTATATDSAGNPASCTFDVSVVDTTPPVLTCPGDVAAGATSPTGVAVDYYFDATVADVADPASTVEYDPPSGSVFPVGTTTVTVAATDGSGNSASCTFTVTVNDTHTPVVACPSSVVAEATFSGGASVTYPAARVSDSVDAVVSVEYSKPSGDLFALGTTTVGVTATDEGGKSATCTFTVTVQDTTPPVLGCPGGITVAATGPSGAVVTYAGATVSDLVDPDPQVSYDVESGSTFPVGATTVTVTATDAAGNSDTCTFEVVVEDGGPSIVCPADIVAEATGPGGALVTYDPAAATDAVDGTLTPTYSKPSGSRFALGTTTVTASATDAAGNTSTCDFDVTVRDTMAPDLACPGGVTASADGPDGTVVSYDAAMVSDVVDPAPTVEYSQRSGTTFPLGVTTVTVVATDAAGNAATCGFDVTIEDTEGPSIVCPPGVRAEATGPAGTIVTFAPAVASDDITGTPVVVYSHASGAVFALGVTTVTVTATDDAGNSASCTFEVDVADTTAPTLTCPGDVTVSGAEAPGGVVSYPPAAATDLVDAAPVVDYSAASGTLFAIGSTMVTVTATDGSGNSSSCTFTVTVNEPAGPSIVCPIDVTEEAESPSGADVEYPPATAQAGEGGDSVIEYTQASGTTFALGGTAVTATARDPLGHTASCVFVVTVSDSIPPRLTCPGSLVVGADDASGAAVSYEPAVAADVVDDSPVVTHSVSSGAQFPVGDSTVDVTATDTSGNSSSCSFTVSVRRDLPPGTSCPAVDADQDGVADRCPGYAGGNVVGRGCGCTAGGSPALFALAAVSLLVARRRRRG